MSSINVALVYAVAGSGLLCLALNMFKIKYKIWQAVLASVVAGVCALVFPVGFSGPTSLLGILATLYYTTGESLSDLCYPVFLTRLALVPALILVGTWGSTLSAAIVSASEAIIRSNSERLRRPMGTTVVALTLKKGMAYEIAWLGDSRVYMFNGELKQLSRVHSFVQECVDRGLLTPEEAKSAGSSRVRSFCSAITV